ncbi:MAG: protein translocase subunit SecF [Pseudomonadota bacterium]|nr:protein translocase subunit SecF [Pseudomonadota bacterium]
MRLLKFVPENTNIHFLKWRLPFFALSGLLVIASWVLIAVNGLNLGVDFVGGQMIRVTFTHSAAAPVGALRSEVASLGYGDPIIQTFGAPNAVSIRMQLPPGAARNPALASAMSKAIIARITAKQPDTRLDGIDLVSGKVSKELGWSAFEALGFAAIAISFYIWYRFEWQFGAGALLSLVHDVSLTLGLFALTQMEFDLNIVAAVLTIIGYSLNDTIVVYDRIRENLKKFRRMPMPELLDLSVNETLSRTVMTSAMMLITLLALLLLGPRVIFGFTAAITMGIFVGSYSSIYMAAPLLIWLKVTSKSFVPGDSKLDRQEQLARGQK